MYEYTKKDRDEVTSRRDNPIYEAKSVNMSMMYAIYDLLRIMLVSMGNIESMMVNTLNPKKEGADDEHSQET